MLTNMQYSILAVIESLSVLVFLGYYERKKRFLTQMFILVKILVFLIAILDVITVMMRPLLKVSIMILFPICLRQMAYMIVLIAMIICNRIGNNKNVCILMGVILCLDILSIIWFYPTYIEYYRQFLNPGSHISQKVFAWMSILMKSLPFNNNITRVFVTLIELGLLLRVYYKTEKVCGLKD